MQAPENGIITRVRMEAQASDLGDCQRALDRGFSVVHAALVHEIERERGTLSATAAGVVGTGPGNTSGTLAGSSPFAGADVFPRESEFVEEVYESKIRSDGSIYYAGRRVISFDSPVEGFSPQSSADLASAMMPGGLLSDDDRLRRLELDYRVENAGAWRESNGIWTVNVKFRDGTMPARGVLQRPADGGAVTLSPDEDPGWVSQVTGQGATLSIALSEVEHQVWPTDWPRHQGDGRLVTFELVVPGANYPRAQVWVAPDVTIWRAAEIICQQEGWAYSTDFQLRAVDGSLVFHGATVEVLDLSQVFTFGPPR